MNPRLIIQLWKQFISEPYAESIANGDFNYFIEKDYTRDVKLLDDADKIVTSIEKLLRHSLKNMIYSHIFEEHLTEKLINPSVFLNKM